MPVAQATSTRRQVQVQLDASQQSSVKVGNKTEITLPDNHSTSGTVAQIGTVASASGSGSGSSTPTIPVYVTLEHPTAGGRLDEAPVQVQITTAGVKHALIVPVNALVSRSGGAYAVETVDARGVHHLVPVTVGLFDDAEGLVQVTSKGLAAGDRVVVLSA
jgi:multidrug efflux pump subunit AcrA (membrane-fusion protein)